MTKKIISILLGSFLIASGINLFVIPNHLLDGGIIGLGLIGKYAFQFQPGLTIIFISVPLYMIAFFFNRRYFYNGIHGLLVSSFFIDLLHPFVAWNPPSLMVSSIFGGLTIGVGIGIMLSAEVSSGATDLVALLLAKLTNINAGIFIFFFDCFVLLLGYFFIPEVTIFYSSIMVTVIGITTFSILTMSKKDRHSYRF